MRRIRFFIDFRMDCCNIFIILDLACRYNILTVTKNCIQFFIYRIQFFIRVIVNVAGVAIVAYLPERTPNSLPNVGGVNTLKTTLAFGHTSVCRSELKKILKRTWRP
jgi:hypothetical protein